MDKPNSINSLKAGDNVKDFLCILKDIKLQESSNGSKYYSLTIQDKSGELKGKIWGDKISKIKDIEKYTGGEIIEIDASVQSYMGNLQIIISEIIKSSNTDISKLMITGKMKKDLALEKLSNFISKIDDKEIKKLLDNIFTENILKKYSESPAAVNYHHAFVGGLLEHVIEMLELSEPYQYWYPNANFNIIWAGIILHDIGKIEEIQREGASFNFTTKGKLIGHINLGSEFVYKHLPKDFPEEKWLQIQHIIISHHRELEYGAAVVPSSIEAAIVSVCDLGSSWVRQFDQAINESLNTNKEFSEYKKTIGAGVYLKSNDKIKSEKLSDSVGSNAINSHQMELF